MCVVTGCNTRGGVTSRDSEQITSLTTRYGLPRAAIVASVWRDSTTARRIRANLPRDINKPARSRSGNFGLTKNRVVISVGGCEFRETYIRGEYNFETNGSRSPRFRVHVY